MASSSSSTPPSPIPPTICHTAPSPTNIRPLNSSTINTSPSTEDCGMLL